MIDAIDRTMNSLEATYLNKFRLPPEQKAEWRASLQGLSAEELQTGVIEARAEFDEWPPNLIQFRRLCLKNRAKSEDKEKNLIDLYNDWARDKHQKNNYGLHRPGETAEQFRNRLVWEDGCRRRNCSSDELHAIVQENIQGNRERPGGWTRDPIGRG